MFSKFNLQSILSIIVIALFIGVMFVYADWTPAPGSPPTCPSSEPGCNPPVNVGSALQYKTGSLGVGGSLEVLGAINSIGGLCLSNGCETSWPSSSYNNLCYCIQCHENQGGGQSYGERCTTFGNWTGISTAEWAGDKNESGGCRIRLYSC